MSSQPTDIILYDAASQQWLQFRQPQAVVTATAPAAVQPQLRHVEAMVQRYNLTAVGFLAYEAAPGFDPALRTHAASRVPLLWFGLFDAPTVLPGLPPPTADYQLGDWLPSLSQADYRRAIDRIKEYIRSGDTYQVNYSFRLNASFSGAPYALFHALVEAQQCQYAAFLDLGSYAICSASPELFFRLDGARLTSRPMKGTARRGATLPQDQSNADWLHQSPKNRAENVMIVDMIRNDLGRVAEVGTVRVPSLFDVERYPTVWQMTSTVEATTRAALSDIMAALFPCASITGAPKARTMEIITETESAPRHIYTGAIGFIAPGRRAQFNVAIRTVLVDRTAGQAEYGVGGGIVWDSDSGDEYRECQLKAEVLTKGRPDFCLLETMLWTPEEGTFLLDYHLRRLSNAAVYFGYPLNVDDIVAELQRLGLSLPPQPHKIRLLVTRAGAVELQPSPLDLPDEPLPPARLKLASQPIDPANPFLYHKTTHRVVYTQAKAQHPDADDVLLWNPAGHITEACIANVVVQFGDERVTPPLDSGLLGGTFRAWLLDQGRISERVISIEQLKQADKLYVINSVRKWREAVVEW